MRTRLECRDDKHKILRRRRRRVPSISLFLSIVVLITRIRMTASKQFNANNNGRYIDIELLGNKSTLSEIRIRRAKDGRGEQKVKRRIEEDTAITVSPSLSSKPSMHPSTSLIPSQEPSLMPSSSSQPSMYPSISQHPSSSSSNMPSSQPSTMPSSQPSVTTLPSSRPSSSSQPSEAPSSQPSSVPSTKTLVPSTSSSPSILPSQSIEPSLPPSQSKEPTQLPSLSTRPSSAPSSHPSVSDWPSYHPSLQPSDSAQPTLMPSSSSLPSYQPSLSFVPTSTDSPSQVPSLSSRPSSSGLPSSAPSQLPSSSAKPSSYPSSSFQPSIFPSKSNVPSEVPTPIPTPTPTKPQFDTATPTALPSNQPTLSPIGPASITVFSTNNTLVLNITLPDERRLIRRRLVEVSADTINVLEKTIKSVASRDLTEGQRVEDVEVTNVIILENGEVEVLYNLALEELCGDDPCDAQNGIELFQIVTQSITEQVVDGIFTEELQENAKECTSEDCSTLKSATVSAVAFDTDPQVQKITATPTASPSQFDPLSSKSAKRSKSAKTKATKRSGKGRKRKSKSTQSPTTGLPKSVNSTSSKGSKGCSSKSQKSSKASSNRKRQRKHTQNELIIPEEDEISTVTKWKRRRKHVSTDTSFTLLVDDIKTRDEYSESVSTKMYRPMRKRRHITIAENA